MKKVGVLGSINTDLVTSTRKKPQTGETVEGLEFNIKFGGKGANVAVAAARLSSSVTLFASVGDDSFSKESLTNLKSQKINIKYINKCSNISGGIANITVCNKNNSIIIVPGANNKTDVNYVKKVGDEISKMDIVGSQLEIPTEAVLEVSKICKSKNIPFVFNPSPMKVYPKEIFNNSSYVLVNEVEIKSLYGYKEKDPYAVLKNYPNKLILTKGSDGVYFYNGEKIEHIKAIKVKTIDTTGAGDTFMGAFMSAVSCDKSLYDAVKFANTAAGLKTTKLGAQTAMPTMSEMKSALKE